MHYVPPGGPSTINGVLYQMLWALCRVGSIQGIGSAVNPATKELSGITLILEPLDGGDQQVLSGEGRVVEQLKTRAGSDTWSLQEIIQEVLPDLYRAVDLRRPETKYRFVTEGRRGDWKVANDFFGTLKDFPRGTDPTAFLDDKDELKFRRQQSNQGGSGFWGAGPYTRHRLFERIVATIREGKIGREEPIAISRQKVVHLLSRFVFEGNRTFDAVQATVNAWLLSVIEAVEDLDHRRDQLLLDLARRATAGDARVEASEFLASHGLTATPLTDWLKLCAKSRRTLQRQLQFRGFEPADEARPRLSTTIAARWTSEQPILVLTGESGQGKTWLGNSLLSMAAEQEEVALLVEARGNADEDLEVAAALFWNDVVGHDKAPPFSRIRERLRRLGPLHASRPLCLMVDRVIDPTEGRRLAMEDWAEWGIRLLVTCPIAVAAGIRAAAGSRCQVVEVPDFSVHELHTFLETAAGDEWPAIPADVRATLRRPLLARLYRDLAGGSAWRPTNEYELYKKFWSRLFEDAQSNRPLDAENLKAAAYSLLNDAAYPWSTPQLCTSTGDDSCIDRLLHVGWLRSRGEGKFAIWHDRLLNWAVAEALCDRLQRGQSTGGDICEIFRQLNDWRAPTHGQFLRDVPFDFLWLVTRPPQEQTELAVEMFHVLEGDLSIPLSNLYGNVLSCLGSQIIPALFTRLEKAAEVGAFDVVNAVIGGLDMLDAEQVSSRAQDLLGRAPPLVQRAAARILTRKPTPAALDRLWALHCASHRSPEAFVREHEHALAAYQDTFTALRVAVAIAPDWLEAAIQRADPAREPVYDLAYLLATIRGSSERWQRCKPLLFQKVPPDQERSLVQNIRVYGDNDEKGWLLSRVDSDDGILATSAMRALIQMDPQLALNHLDQLGDRELYLSRDFCVAELLSRLPDVTRQRLRDRLGRHPEPWSFAGVFQGQEDALDLSLLDGLFDALRNLLKMSIADESNCDPRRENRLSELLLAVQQPDLLDQFRHQRGSVLEKALAQWMLLQGPQEGVCVQGPKVNGLRLLAKIGGEGFTTVVNQWLATADRYGRSHAIEVAARRPDAATIAHLTRITQSEELWDDFPVEQGRAAMALAAMGHWAEVIAYVVRWGSQTLTLVTDFHVEAGTLSDEDLAPALDVLREGQTSPGVLIALGFAHRRDYAGYIRETLERTSPDSELALAGILALARLQDTSEEAVPLIARHLRVPEQRHRAVAALFANQSDAAFDELLKLLRREYDHGLAVSLLSDSRTVDEATRMVRSRMREADLSSKLWMAGNLLQVIHREAVLDEILVEAPLQDIWRELAFLDHESSFPGTAVRCLARFDPLAAFLAADYALKRRGGRQREAYPYLLVEIDPGRAVPLLLKHSRSESSVSVIWSIARSLAPTAYRESLQQLFASQDAVDVLTACRLAGRLTPVDWLIELVQECAIATDDKIAAEAKLALRSLRSAAACQVLVERFAKEPDSTNRWTMLDAILELGDPGDLHQPWPDWANRLAGQMPQVMRTYFENGVSERREKMLARAKYLDT